MTYINGHSAQAEATQEVYQNAQKARDEAVRGLLKTAENIRAEAEKMPQAERDSSLKIARSLEQSANMLNARPVDQVEANPKAEDDMPSWLTLLIVFGLGLIVGWVLSSRKHKKSD